MDDYKESEQFSSERHQLSGKAKKMILILSITVVLIGIFAVVGMAYTSQPNFCASCHEIQPKVVSWSQAAHEEVTCLKCHADPGTVGYVERKVAGLGEVYKHVTNQIPDKIEAKFNTASCIACHTGNSDYPGAKNIKLQSGDLAPSMPHADILQNKTSCLDCHQDVGHSKPI